MYKCLLSLYFVFLAGALHGNDPLQEAFQSYTAAENAKSYFEREKEFNKALSLYSEINEENGKLYYNIGNTFYQLGEYPFAILYYQRALRLAPHDANIDYNLNLAQQKLGITSVVKAPFISRPSIWGIFFFLACFAIACFSFSLWSKKHFWERLAYLFSFMCVLVLGYLTYTHYFEPIEAIVVKDTLIYRAPGYQYPPVSITPTLSGVKVKVIEEAQDGHWLKVSSPDGSIGFIPYLNIRII